MNHQFADCQNSDPNDEGDCPCMQDDMPRFYGVAAPAWTDPANVATCLREAGEDDSWWYDSVRNRALLMHAADIIHSLHVERMDDQCALMVAQDEVERLEELVATLRMSENR